MQQIQTVTTIYKFSELSEEGKQAAIEKLRNDTQENGDYAWQSEYHESLTGFCKSTGITLKNYSYGPYSHNYINWNYELEIDLTKLTGLRLRTWLINNWIPEWEKGKYYSTGGKWIHNKYCYKKRYSNCQKEISCPFTGFVGDMDIIDPVTKFIKSPDNNISLDCIIRECFDSFIKAYCAEMESQDSDEYIIDTIEANDYDFTEDGSIY